MPYERFVFNEVAGFQVSTLLKVNFSAFTFQILRTTILKNPFKQ